MTDIEPTVENSRINELDEVEIRGSGLKRERPFGESRRSTASSKSVVSMNPGVVMSQFMSDNLFCYKNGSLDKAVEQCKTSIVDGSLDGLVQGSWLITEINHWDMEKEKLVLLTTNSILIVHYDFIALRVVDFRRIMLSSVHRIEVGDLVYPELSFMPPRQHGGVRIHWSKTDASFIQRWNPFCYDVGFITLCHHLLAYKPGEHDTVTYDVGDLSDSLIVAMRSHNEKLTVDNGPITVESYASVASLIFNQSHIGFNMSRGGVSF